MPCTINTIISANLHPGNISFRKLVNSHKDAYCVSSNEEKKRIVNRVINLIRASDPPGRFLSEDRGVWTFMDQKSVFRKVGQALREQTKDTNEPKSIVNEPKKDVEKVNAYKDKPPRIINITPPDEQTVVHQNCKRRIQDSYVCNIRNVHKLPKLSYRDIHESQTQQYHMSSVKDEVQMLKSQVAILTKRVAFLEKNDYYIDDINSFRVGTSLPNPTQPTPPQPTPTRVLHSDITKPSSNFRRNSHGLSHVTKQSYRPKPSLRHFSQRLTSSIHGMSRFDEVEDTLVAILTKP